MKGQCAKCGVEIEIQRGENVCGCGHQWHAVVPQEGPQSEFLLLRDVDIAGYGGAAGGGKTWALLLDPTPDLGVPGFGGVVFRRQAVEITNEGGLWDAAGEIYPHADGKARTSPVHRWQFPNGNKLVFTHLNTPETVHDHQGGQYCYLAFDELTHFEEGQFWYLQSRNRSTCGVKPRTRCGFNPDASSWVKVMFAPWVDDEYPDPAKDGEIRWLVRYDGVYHYFRSKRKAMAKAAECFPELTTEQLPHSVKSVTFIEADIYDNPALMTKDPGYLANLLAQSEVERQRLLHKDWNIMVARFFGEWRAKTAEGTPWHVVPTAEVPEGYKYYLATDWGFAAPFACYLLAIAPDRRITVCRELYLREQMTSDLGESMLELMEDNDVPKRTTVYVGRDVYSARLTSAGTRDEPIVATWQRQHLNCQPSGGDPLARASKTREYLADWGPDEGWPDGRPGLQVMDCCVNLIRTLPLLQSDEHRPEVVDTDMEDHPYEALGHVLTMRPGRPKPPAKEEELPLGRTKAAIRARADRPVESDEYGVGL